MNKIDSFNLVIEYLLFSTIQVACVADLPEREKFQSRNRVSSLFNP